jgi:hypothetical protein
VPDAEVLSRFGYGRIPERARIACRVTRNLCSPANLIVISDARRSLCCRFGSRLALSTGGAISTEVLDENTLASTNLRTSVLVSLQSQFSAASSASGR